MKRPALLLAAALLAAPALAADSEAKPALSGSPESLRGRAKGRTSAPDMSKQPAIGPMKPFRSPPRQRFALSNGVQVVLVEDHRFPLVSARLAVRGGTALAGQKDAGLVEAFAELWTAGTSTRSAKDIAYEADAFGGSIGAEAQRDYVVLEAFALSERAGRMFALLGETAMDATFPQEEVELRKKNMLEELKVNRSQPKFLASVAFSRKLFGRHPYSVVAPTEESIARIDRDRLRTLHKRLLVPAQAMIVAAGDIGKDQLAQALEKAFEPWKPTGEPPGPLLPAPQETAGPERRIVLVDRPGSAQTVLALGNLALTEKAPEFFKLLVANQILGGSFAARLMSDLREKKGYTYGIYSSLPAYRSAGLFLIRTQVRTEVTGPAVKDILGHIERIRKEPVTQEELRQAKNTLAGRFVRDLETQQGLADAVLHALIYDLPEDALDTFVQKVQAVTIAEAGKAAKAFFHPENLLIAAVGDGAKIEAELAPLSPKPVEKVDENGEDLAAQVPQPEKPKP
ncbi:MAG: insulinase family protein [Elusimicrobia bacterium]|nr:insulinase family protein [Elusimicrobiota bacterium]